MTYVLNLDKGRIEVTINDRAGVAGSVVSTGLKVVEGDADWEADYTNEWNIAIDMLEGIVLGHACAGIIVWESRYIKGLDMALEALSNNL